MTRPADNNKLQQDNFITGSYKAEDCKFLLQAISKPMMSVEEKEALLQAGKKHYSEMISIESPPSNIYLDLFYSLVNQYKERLAREISSLAEKIYNVRGHDITLLSLARAGTPIGVLLCRALKYYHNANVNHYSISIVRDKGIDNNALKYIESMGHPANSVIFVDGWTAKGVISRELKQAVKLWNHSNDYKIPDDLCVISDIGGTADIAATIEDYAIPSGILNSTVSGLVSRTLLLSEYEGFHQCVLYSHLEEYDLSNWFVDEVSSLFNKTIPITHSTVKKVELEQRHECLNAYIQNLMSKYQISDINKIKPGIAEATRVMLRRIPRLLIVKDVKCSDVVHLLVLAKEKNVETIEDKSMPFNAVALIENVTS